MKTRIYCITCLNNDKMYVGMTRQSVKKRWMQHIYDAGRSKADIKFYRAIRKHGPASFNVAELFVYPTRQEAIEAEISLIAALSLNTVNGYNSSDGGDGGATRTGYSHTAETRAKMSAGALARGQRPNITPEGRKAVADALRGRKRPPEVCAKISASKLGVPRSVETVARMSAARKGKPKTKPCSPKHCAALSAAKRLYWARRRQEAALADALFAYAT